MSFNLSEWALRHRSFILFAIILTSIMGIFAYGALGQKEDPEFTIKTMIVAAGWPGATTTEMADQVTDKIELALQSVPEIDYTKSSTRPGSTTIIVQLRSDTAADKVPDVWYRVRKTVQDAQAQGKLPRGISGPVFNDDFGDTFGNIYALTGDGYSYPQLKTYAEELRNRIRALPQVAKVEFQGDQAERIFIVYQSQKLASLGISPQTLAQALSSNNSVVSAGQIETADERIPLTVSGALSSLEQIRNIGVATPDGRTVRLGDLAQVQRGLIDPPELKMHVNGKEAIGLAISARGGGSITELGKSLSKIMETYQAELPVGVEIHTVADQTVVVHSAIGEFIKSLAEAVIIVMAVSFLSLGFRPGIVVALCIPLVLGATFAVMKVYDIDLQRISLGALIIALGLLVDDAMIVVESIESHLEMGWSKAKAAVSAYAATAMPMLIGTLITIVGFLPIGFSGGTASEYVRSIFQVVAIALILSCIVAVLVTPYIAFQILKVPEGHKAAASDDHAAHAQTGRGYDLFRTAVSWCLDNRVLVLAATGAAFALGVALFALVVPKQFFPASDRPELMVDLRLAHNASFAATERATRRMEALLAGDKDIVNISSYIGGGAPRFYLPLDVQTPDVALGQLVVVTKDEAARERVAEKIESALATGFPELRGRVSGLENGPPVGQPIQIRITGLDHEAIRPSAEAVEALFRSTRHLRGINSDYGERLKTVHLVIDQDKARALGVNYDSLKQALQGSLGGATLTVVREGDRSIEVTARLTKAERTNLATLPYAKIPTASGAYVPLSQLARLVPSTEPSVLWRRDRQAAITIFADVDGAQPAEILTALKPDLDAIKAKLPKGAMLAIGGSEEESKTSQGQVFSVLPVAIVLICLLLMIQLQNIKKMLLVLATGPLAFIGVAATLALFQIPFGFVAMLGSLSLFGMVIRNSVILVARVDELTAKGTELRTAIIEATMHRVRPILLTAAAAILAMIPLCRSVFWGPMAYSTMGGLFVATFLTLFFLPALYQFAFQNQTATPALETAE
jgi:multidrug efflux pump